MFLISLTLGLGVNVGLALQHSYTALLTLRCFQSIGSSGAMVISSATVADLVTRAERGKYLAYSSLGSTLGPAVGPVLGGVLTKFLGWRSVFWFLAIFTGVMLFFILCFMRETCRAVVGNGSIPPQSWNKPLILELVSPRSFENPDYETRLVLPSEDNKRGFFSQILLGALDGLKMILTKPVNLLVLCSTVIYCGFMAVMSSIPALLQQKYHFNPLQIGLCYLPFAAGGFASRWTIGSLADWNFRRHGRQVGIEVQRNQQTRKQLLQIPLEKVRLQLVLPLVYFSCLVLLGYSWAMNYNVHISCLLIMLFLLGNAFVGMNNMIVALLIDLNASRPATAVAGMNMYRFLVGAGAVAAVLPLVHVVGIGWVGTIIAGLWFLASSGLWVIYSRGHAWRLKSQSVLA